MLAAGALIQSLGKRESKLRRRSMKAWKRFERSDAMRDTLEEIRQAGRLAPIPVSSPVPDSEKNESDSPNGSQIAHSNHNSMDPHLATESIP
jgi:hypothetical protein